MTSFSVGGTTGNFTALSTSYSDKGGALEQITVGALVASASDWGALFSLRSWGVTQRPIPGGNTVYVDVQGGAGAGSLVLDNFDSHTAILTDIGRDLVEPGAARSRATLTFIVTA